MKILMAYFIINVFMFNTIIIFNFMLKIVINNCDFVFYYLVCLSKIYIQNFLDKFS